MDRILDSSRRLSAGLRKPAWVALALLAAPVIYLLAGAQPIVAHKPHRGDRLALVAAVTGPGAEPQRAGMQAPPAGPPTPAASVAPAAPKFTPAPAVTPKAAWPWPPPSTVAWPWPGAWPPQALAGKWEPGDRGEVVIISYGKPFFFGSGPYNGSDLEHFRALRRVSNADLIWFRRDGKSYIVRNAATVQRAKALQEELRRQMDQALQEEKPFEQLAHLGRAASLKMRPLLDNAIAKGLAQPE